ncbi:MAG: sigma-70 family RNA polymerase sigma factor [Planctomycetes bacterium]|nr:sigma-70 family RNA polymerase sigma factor [Planctomycetota bacterium]
MSSAHVSPAAGNGSSSERSSSTSRSLLERVKANEQAAWDRLVTLYAPLVCHWCRRWDLQEHDVADVFQEVFQAVVTHIAAFRRDLQGDTFRGWLRTITQNKVNDHLRRMGREPRAAGGTHAQIRLAQFPDREPAADGALEETSSEDDLERSLFWRCLDLIRGEFEERTWQAFWRTAVDGQIAREVAAELGMSAGAVRVAKCRVLRRLRQELGDLK